MRYPPVCVCLAPASSRSQQQPIIALCKSQQHGYWDATVAVLRPLRWWSFLIPGGFLSKEIGRVQTVHIFGSCLAREGATLTPRKILSSWEYHRLHCSGVARNLRWAVRKVVLFDSVRWFCRSRGDSISISIPIPMGIPIRILILTAGFMYRNHVGLQKFMYFLDRGCVYAPHEPCIRTPLDCCRIRGYIHTTDIILTCHPICKCTIIIVKWLLSFDKKSVHDSKTRRQTRAQMPRV